MFLFWDSTYLAYMIPGLLLTLLAQWWVNSTYRKWSKVQNTQGLSGAEAAKRLLSSGGLGYVGLQGIQGQLTDNYDPRSQTLNLSQGVAQTRSVAALAIAAHEIGHAMQDQKGYLPMRLRSALVPAVSIGSNLGLIMIMGGLLLRGMLGVGPATQIAWLGVLFFAGGAVFALATLPVELDASARAKRLLKQAGLITSPKEAQGVSAVLRAAAFTYVAGLAAAILQLLYFVSLVGGMGGRRRG
ncbi:MAG: zinc metallopeptidase [Anaerolineales bacterium]